MIQSVPEGYEYQQIFEDNNNNNTNFSPINNMSPTAQAKIEYFDSPSNSPTQFPQSTVSYESGITSPDEIIINNNDTVATATATTDENMMVIEKNIRELGKRYKYDWKKVAARFQRDHGIKQSPTFYRHYYKESYTKNPYVQKG